MDKLKFTRTNTLVSYFSLLLFIIIDLAINSPVSSITSLIAIMVIKCLPLCLPIVGIIKGNVRSHSWLCFIVTIYFISGVLRATTPTQLTWGLIEVFLSVEVFVCAMMYVRWKKVSV
jgi:uncharacterized membrane protein